MCYPPPPELAEKRRLAGRGAVAVVFLVALTQLLLFFLLYGDQSDSAADSLSPNAAAPDERLLGGLLSPDMDEDECLSRYEASKRWKPSPFPVSPYLVQRLRHYESIHRRCGPRTAFYGEAVAQLQSGSGGRNGDGNATELECKYVVWLPVQGLGNWMLSLVSSFLYALLTGRVLLLHDPPEMDGLFCDPFPGTTWLAADLPLRNHELDALWSGSKESYTSMLENNIVRYNDGDGELPPYVYFDLESPELRLPNHAFCEEDHRLLDRFTWMVLRSDSYFAVALFLMPMYRAELDRMFPAKGSVFHHLGRYLLHPGNRVWGMVERFFDGYLAGADERLGVQVRNKPPPYAVPFEIMYEQILRCAREHDLLPQLVEFASSKSSNSTAATATEVKKKKKKKKTTAVLVVSLKPEYYEKLHATYYTNAMMTGDAVAVYQPSHDQDQHTEARAHNERALAEIYLLSFCDRVVTTGWSTFGYVAHALAGLRPWLLLPLDQSKMRADVACVRPPSVEPCLHARPSLVCRAGQQVLQPVAHVPFLRRCEDVRFGLKLFD